MLLPDSDTYFLEERVHFSLKVATKGCLGGTKKTPKILDFTVFLKQNGRKGTKKFKVSQINLECSCLVQIHIFWKWVRNFFLKVATKGYFRVKKTLKIRFLDCFSKAKREECDQWNWSFSAKFCISIPWVGSRCTHFIESNHQRVS